jgi:hypothetical protein
LILLVVFAAGNVCYVSKSGQWRLQRVIAELDIREPGWRLEDLEARRKVIPLEQNSAWQILAAADLLPAHWPVQKEKLGTALSNLAPEIRLSEQQTGMLRAELRPAQSALAKARALADLPSGRFAVTYTGDGLSPPEHHLRQMRNVVAALRYDALLKCEDADFDGALVSCRAVFNAERALTEELLSVSQVSRLAFRHLALLDLERILAQGQPYSRELATLQALLTDEDKQQPFLVGARGDRASLERTTRALQSGKIKLSQLAGYPIRPMSGLRVGSMNVDDLLYQLYFGSAAANGAALLEYKNRVVEIAKLPVESQGPPFERLENTLPTQPPFVRLFVHGAHRLFVLSRRTQAELRCAIAALALERYRRDHAGWTDSLTALVPKYLSNVPLDPYDGAQLRLRRLDDGIVVYSVGIDGKDDGGNISRTSSNPPGTDIGFRLWDVDRRRQSPK